MKKMYKNVTISVIFIIFVLISAFCFYVNAKDDLPKCTTYFGTSNNPTANGYSLGLTLTSLGNNQYSLSVNDAAGAKNNDLHFQIIGVQPSGNYPTETFQSGSKTLTINGTIKADASEEVDDKVVVTVKVTTSKCQGDSTNGAVTYTVSLGDPESGGVWEGNDMEDDSDSFDETEETIEDSSETSASFDEKLKLALEGAKKSNNYFEDLSTNGIKNLRESSKKDKIFQCEKNLKKSSNEIKFDFDKDLNNDSEYYLEENTKYLYAKAKQNVNVGKYYYYYHSWKNPKPQDIICKVQCEEGVEVKYGPPVASKAGLCFEYKVRVESRVKCKPTSINRYKSNGVCTPGPKCVAADHSYVSHQGGPNDSFDACIKECDGGKYTEKCSDKCYKKIYKNNKNKNVSNSNVVNARVKLLADSNEMSEDVWTNEAKNYKGYNGYYFQNGSSINWKPSDVESYWHQHNNWGIAGHKYTVIKNGIPRTAVCTDSCSWKTSCLKKDKYLNKGNKYGDIKRNKDAFEKAKIECKKYTKCSTEVAEFTISTDYTNENGKNTVEFPYENKKDTLASCGESGGTNTMELNDTTLNKDLITNSEYDNCYGGKKECSVNNYYLSEWSFPGSWINKKTGEISYKYKNPESDKVWREKTRKYCIPRDAYTVNNLWYQWYLHKVENLTAKNDDECLTSEEKEIIQKEDFDQEIEYNIKASTKKFGYFYWNIEMQCFYAIYTNDKAGTTCGTGERTRTVDNDQIIPESRKKDSEGNEKVGFNWTEIGKLPAKAVTGNSGGSNASGSSGGSGGAVSSSEYNYLVNPETVRTKIEEKSSKIYIGTEYVDYEFDLNRTDLSNIKNYNKNINLGLYCGNGFIETDGYEDSTGEKITIVHYISNLFSGSGRGSSSIDTKKCEKASSLKIPTKILPSDTTLRCNNISKNKGSCGQD